MDIILSSCWIDDVQDNEVGWWEDDCKYKGIDGIVSCWIIWLILNIKDSKRIHKYIYTNRINENRKESNDLLLDFVGSKEGDRDSRTTIEWTLC